MMCVYVPYLKQTMRENVEVPFMLLDTHMRGIPVAHSRARGYNSHFGRGQCNVRAACVGCPALECAKTGPPLVLSVTSTFLADPVHVGGKSKRNKNRPPLGGQNVEKVGVGLDQD